MHPRALALLLFSCAPTEPPPAPPPPSWIYEPARPAWQLGELRGQLGRSQAPQRPLAAGVVGPVTGPLRLATPWAVPGSGPARAIVYGIDGGRSAIELVDVDRGQLMWRDGKTCTGPIVGVTDKAIVCTDASGVRAVGLDGKSRWHSESPYIAITDERVVVAGPGEAIVLGADDGDELAHIKLPPAVSVETIVASCGDAGRELFALGRDGKLMRVAEARGGPAVSWSTPIGAIADLDPCTGDSVLVTSGASVIALARATGKVTGRVDGVRGHWRARDGSDRIELTTSGGVASWPRDLAGPPIAFALPPLGELLATRADRRLVRATRLTAVVLDRDGVRAYIPLSAMGAVLGDTAILGASWLGSGSESVHLVGLPPRTRRRLRVPAQRPGVALPAELRDLPSEARFDPARAIPKPDTGKHAVVSMALDPREPAVLYAVALEEQPTTATTATIASVDLAKRTWRWQRSGGCGPGTPIALAVGDVVACAARGTTATVRATSRDGVSGWEWATSNVDALQAAGDSVLVFEADRLAVLDAATGRVRARFTSDDGAAMRATALALERDAGTWLFTYEGGRLVARLPSAGMLAVWSLRVDGVVRALSPSGEGVLVELEDGDAFRVDARTAEVTAMPGMNLTWQASGELVTGQTAGGPIPGPPPPVPPRPRPVFVPPKAIAARETEPPPIWTPIRPSPSLGDSWQYTLYELTGGLRARNDYALAAPIAPAVARGPSGSPLVVAYGQGLHAVLVLDPRTGDPLRRVLLPEDAPPGLVFGTIVDGTPVAGALLASPLRAVLF